MAVQRPRLSVLALFDPLSESSSSDSDKENEFSDSSFFRPHGFSKQIYSPVRTLRRRLIDVGDVTVVEPGIRDLIEEELEAEINESVALEEDENATLTFRDMAMAATPKWSGKHAARTGTPRTLSTPRTPLADIITRDEITPVRRKKAFKRPVTTSASEASPLNVIHAAENVPILVIHDLDNTSGNPPFVPHAEISGTVNETTKRSTFPNSMGTSTATLELPTSSGPLISDTPTPLFLSVSSLEPSHASRSPSPLSESTLRPNVYRSQSINRHSVDLHASFQLHLSSSETTFDLLNDKISFLGSKNGSGSCLDHEDVSFGDGEDFGAMNGQLSSEMVSSEQRTAETQLSIRKVEVSKTKLEEQVNDPGLHDVKDRGASFPGRSEIPTSPTGKKCSDTVLDYEAASSVLSTPSPSHPTLHPPPPVPALRIVKRTKTLDQAKVAERGDLKTSREKSSISASRAPKRTLLEDAASVLTGNGIKNGDQAKTINRSGSGVVRDDQSADGPRRVLMTEVPNREGIGAKAQLTTVQGKLLTGVNGPRRIPASSNMGKPAKPGTGSGIPKPVSGRKLGTRIPAPSSKWIQEGKGYLGRWTAGK